MGTEVLQFLDSLAIRHQDDFEEKDNIILFFISSWCNNSSYNSNRPNAKQLTRQGTEKILSPNSSDDLCLLFCINSSSMSHTPSKLPNISKLSFSIICNWLIFYNPFFLRIWPFLPYSSLSLCFFV